MAPSDKALERWDLYPFGERSPSKIWDRLADHPAWSPSPAQIAPQFLPAYQIENQRLVTNLISSVWGYRASATGIRVAAHLFARIQTTPAGRTLRVLRCLTFEEVSASMYRKILAYLIGLGMIQGCRRIDWEIVDPGTVAVPATFDLIGPCSDPGIGAFLSRQGFRSEQKWAYHLGPVAFGPAGGGIAGRLSSVEERWKEYAGRHFTRLLPHPVPGFDLPVLGRFLPGGSGDTIFRPFGGGSIGQWCPDLAPLIEDRGRWDEARLRVTTIRLLRLFPLGTDLPAAGTPLLLPEPVRERFPGAATLQIGPLPENAGSLAATLEAAGFSRFATLHVMTYPL